MTEPESDRIRAERAEITDKYVDVCRERDSLRDRLEHAVESLRIERAAHVAVIQERDKLRALVGDPPSNPLQKYKLQRATGPLTFEGQLLSEATTPPDRAESERRSFRLALYRAKSGRLVAEFAYTSQWPTEAPVYDAGAFDADVTAEQLIEWFEEAAGIDPDDESGHIGCVKGVVPGTNLWEVRNERTQAFMRDEFDRCLSVVLDLPMFEERV